MKGLLAWDIWWLLLNQITELAKKSIETYLKNGGMIGIPAGFPEEFTKKKAGVFVSLKKRGALRGCIGTFLPTTENIATEVVRNAVESATRDPRFPKVTEDEIKDLEISVDILTFPEQVEDKKDLDPKKYGLIVKSGDRRGLLLPDIEGVGTVDQQIEICRQKGGIQYNAPVELYRFEVKRYK